MWQLSFNTRVNDMNTRRSLHERLSTKKALVGFIQTRPYPEVAELAGLCGYDFLLLDDEHGLFTWRDHAHMLQALVGLDIAVMVRLSSVDTRAVGCFMDLGVDGVVAPHVSTAQQAEALAKAMVYPPAGTRGFGAAAHRATRYGMDIAAHRKAPRANVSLLVMIESALGVANAREILAVKGVDGAIVGPADLSADLGAPGDFACPAYREALEYIERAAAASGKPVGTVPHAGYALDTLYARGHRVFFVGGDVSLIREAMCAQVEKAKSSF
jgi:2-keto-3-deoxy-L-rhamnonate aldolase RhmA